MPRRKKAPPPPPPAPGAPEWMLTYGDMVTLLLCLFVLLFSYSSMNVPKFLALKESLDITFNVPPIFQRKGGEPTLLKGGSGVTSGLDVHKNGPFPRIAKRLQRHFLTTPLKNIVFIEHKRNKIRVRISSNELFFKGSANIKQDTEEILYSVSPLFDQLSVRLFRFIGHTDEDPISKKEFPSNWELSSARAAAVARFYMEAFSLPPEKISVEGRSSFDPVFPNDSEENKARNRRVEIILSSFEEVSSDTRRTW